MWSRGRLSGNPSYRQQLSHPTCVMALHSITHRSLVKVCNSLQRVMRWILFPLSSHLNGCLASLCVSTLLESVGSKGGDKYKSSYDIISILCPPTRPTFGHCNLVLRVKCPFLGVLCLAVSGFHTLCVIQNLICDTCCLSRRDLRVS